MNRFRLRPFSLLTLAMVATSGLVAQDSTGQIVGSVKSKAGAPIAGVEVRFTAPTLQGVRVVVTDANGSFRAPLLPPGSGYTIATSKTGFVGSKVEGIYLGLGQILRQDLVMVPVQAASATVEVVASAAAVDKTDVKTSTNVSSEMMDVLPRFTRGMDTAALLAPGVATNSTQGNRVQIRGAQTTGNRFLLNGTDIADNVFANTDGRSYYVDDSVAETQVISSPVNAKFGGFTGGVINAVTKVGSNEFQGIFRANLSRNSWSAIPPLGMRPGGAKPNPGSDLLNRNYTLWVGGPILKDTLWFSASTKLDPAQATANNLADVSGLLTGDSPTASRGPGYVPSTTGQAFNIISANQFYEVKLTYAINADHSLELAGNRNVTDQQNRYYVSSPDPSTLVPQKNINEYQTLGYRGLFGTSLTVEARYAKKHQVLSAGGDPVQGDPIRARYSNGGYYIFQNGIFDKTDGGDNRDIKTYTAGLTWYTPNTFLGTHTVEAGFELLRQDRQAANAQTPTGRQFLVWGRNADGTYRVAGLSTSATAYSQNYVLLYSVDKGVAKTDTDGYYLNDTWALTDRWQVMGGIRFDKTTAKDTLGSPTVSSSATSPRLQVRWDPWGDQSWLATASYAKYTGKLNDSFTNRFTRAGNPISESYGWGGAADNAISYANVTNIANWDLTTLRSYSGPLARFADSHTKAPSNDEISLGIKHTYTDGSYINLTYTKRTGKHFFNDIYTIGDEVQVPVIYSTAVSSTRVYAERWATDDRLKRDYKSVELDFMNRFNAKWSLGGNYTLASLKGNSEGSEGNNPPVSGDTTADFESVHASRGRDWSYYAPYGYLTGDVKHRARIFLNYVDKSAAGATFNCSLLFNYTGGGVYSLTRDNYFEAYDDALASGSTIASQYASFGSYNHYFGGRGIGRFNDTMGFDFKMGAEVPLWNKVRYFLELTVYNVFNHWQQATFSTQIVSGSNLLTTDPTAGYRVQPITGRSTNNVTGWGTYGFGDYAGGRSMAVSTGIKW